MKQFFTDKTGKLSSTRLQFFLSCVAGLVIAISSVFLESVTLGDSLPMVITLLSYSLGAKIFGESLNKK